jgi:hypothetical protein
MRHEWISARLGSYIVNDLRPMMVPFSDGARIVDWDGSRALRKGLVLQLFLEKCLFAVLLVGPSLVVLWLCRYCSSTAYKSLYAGGCISVLGALGLFAVELIRLRRFQIAQKRR